VIVPALCAVHCLAAPLLVVVAPLVAENPVLEWGGFLLAAAVAVYVAGAGTVTHGQLGVWAPIVGGLLLWLGGLLDALGAAPEWLVTMTGASLVATGMIWDAQLRHRCAVAMRVEPGSCEGLGSIMPGPG
jgi:hypothetical protein